VGERMWNYEVFTNEGKYLRTIQDTSVANACKQFIASLDRPAQHRCQGHRCALIGYKGSVFADFKIQEESPDPSERKKLRALLWK
jgi:hypothetical protein